MNTPMIEGLSAVGISLIILAIFSGSQPNSLRNMSSDSIVRNVGFNISDATQPDDTFYSRGIQRGGKKTRKNKL